MRPMSKKIDPEHRIDDLLFEHWEHPATEGQPVANWREPATRSYRLEVRGQMFRTSQRALLWDYEEAVAKISPARGDTSNGDRSNDR
jgi:hypothetical protein